MIGSILLTSISLSLAIMGLWVCFNWQGMILEPLAWHIEQLCYTCRIPHYVLKPLWSCPTCMSSVWGGVYYIAYGYEYLSLTEMLVIVPITAFLNTLWCILLSRVTDEGC